MRHTRKCQVYCICSNFCILDGRKYYNNVQVIEVFVQPKKQQTKAPLALKQPLHLPNRHTLHQHPRSIHQSLRWSNPIFPHLPRLQRFPQLIKPQHRIPKLTLLQALIEIIVPHPGGILYLTGSFGAGCEHYVPTPVW